MPEEVKEPRVKSAIELKMDEAAIQAGKDLDMVFENLGNTQDLCNWMKWHYSTAGYKRLSKLMIAKAE